MPHMKMNIRKNICPVTELGEGYSLKLVDVSDLTQSETQAWYSIQHQRENVRSHDKLILPDKGVVTFALYLGEIIACGCSKHISDDITENGHFMVLPDHRRKGLFKALVEMSWRHCYLKGYTWINLSPVVQVNFWERHGAEMGWVK